MTPRQAAARDLPRAMRDNISGNVTGVLHKTPALDAVGVLTAPGEYSPIPQDRWRHRHPIPSPSNSHDLCV